MYVKRHAHVYSCLLTSFNILIQPADTIWVYLLQWLQREDLSFSPFAIAEWIGQFGTLKSCYYITDITNHCNKQNVDYVIDMFSEQILWKIMYAWSDWLGATYS